MKKNPSNPINKINSIDNLTQEKQHDIKIRQQHNDFS